MQRLKPVALTQPSAAALPAALVEPMDALNDTLATLEAGLGGDVQIRSITASLVSAWQIIARDPGFEIAAADLLAAARALASPIPAPGPARLLRLLRDAQTRLHDRLLSARVEEQSVKRSIWVGKLDSTATEAVEQGTALKQDGTIPLPSRDKAGVPNFSFPLPTAEGEDEDVEIAALARILAPRNSTSAQQPPSTRR